MTDDLIERAEKALEEFAKAREKYGNVLAKDIFASEARTLLPEAIKEIKRLRKQITAMALDNMASADQAAENNTRAEAAEAKLVVAVGALEPFAKAATAPPEHGACIYNPPEGVEYSLNALDLGRARAALAEIKGEK